MSGAAARQRSSWLSTSWPSRQRACRPAAAPVRRPGAGGAGRACRPRSARMPSSRARKRASGISSCESGKKKMRLPASCARWRRQRACARALGAGAVTARSASAATPKARRRGLQPGGGAFGAEREGRGAAAARRAPRAPRAVSARKGCASRKRVFGPTAGRSRARRGGKKSHRADAQRREQAAGTGLRPRRPARRPPAAAARRRRPRPASPAPARRGRRPRPA